MVNEKILQDAALKSNLHTHLVAMDNAAAALHTCRTHQLTADNLKEISKLADKIAHSAALAKKTADDARHFVENQ